METTVWCPNCGEKFEVSPPVRSTEHIGNLVVGNYLEVTFGNMRIRHQCGDTNEG